MLAWKPFPMWQGGTCYIIGGGTSIAEQFEVPLSIVTQVKNKTLPLSAYSKYLTYLHDKHTIGINIAYQIGTWIDIIFFGDNGFYQAHKNKLLQYPGIVATCAPCFIEKKKDNGIKFLNQDPKKRQGISTNISTVAWNGNSGAAAISLAVHLGVKKIVLLGFDMNLDSQGSSHWHSEYEVRNRKQSPFAKHLQGFPAIARDAKNMGVDIINANPNSAIHEFPKKSIKEIIEDGEKI